MNAMRFSQYREHKHFRISAPALFAVVLAFIGVEWAAAEDPPVTFTRVIIDPKPPGRPWYKMVGDIDGDGDLDVIVGGAKGLLAWYAYPGWRNTQIADGGWNSVKGEIADIDSDGDVEETIPDDLHGRVGIVDAEACGLAIVDLGAYEYSSAYWGNLDNWDRVDLTDCAVMANAWLTDDIRADVYPNPAGAGIVDAADLALLGANWLTDFCAN